MKLIFDLDGTLIDSRQRLHALFRTLSGSPMDFDAYWQRKRAKISNEVLLREAGHDDAAVADFQARWMSMIETDHYLDMDMPFDGVDAALDRLGGGASLYLCTARQDPEAAERQLRRMGLAHRFERILVTRQERTKDELIAEHVGALSPRDWLLGDTGKDVQTARALGIRSCAVLSGFLSRESLEPYGPDLLLDHVCQFEPPAFAL